MSCKGTGKIYTAPHVPPNWQERCPGCEDCICDICEGEGMLGVYMAKGVIQPPGTYIDCNICNGTGRRLK